MHVFEKKTYLDDRNAKNKRTNVQQDPQSTHALCLQKYLSD